jgi:hypothetical protein
VHGSVLGESRQTSQDSHVESGQRGPGARFPLLLGLLVLNACHAGTNSTPTVSVTPEPTPSDAGATLDGSAAADAGRPERPPTPNYPAAESELTLPYRGRAVSTQLVLDPQPGRLDLQMNVDTTESFGDEIDELQRELSRTIIPKLRARVADASFGVSRFADFPRVPFGSPGSPPAGDRPYVLLTPVTGSLSRVTAAVAGLDQPLGHGGDYPEAGAESLYQIATGAGFQLDHQWLIAPFDAATSDTRVAAKGGGTLGGVGFRSQALRVVLHVTDAKSHAPEDYAAQGIPNTHGWTETIDALNALQVHALAIMSTGCRDASCRSNPYYTVLRDELSLLAYSTGATRAPVGGSCPTGIEAASLPTYQDSCPLVYDVADDGSGLSDTVTDAVVGLLDGVRFAEVHAESGDDPLGFVQRVELAPVTQPAGVLAAEASDRLPQGMPDGVPDSYLHVERKNRLGFKVTLRNARIAPSDVTQHYRVSVRLLGDGLLLEERYLGVQIPAAQDADGG